MLKERKALTQVNQKEREARMELRQKERKELMQLKRKERDWIDVRLMIIKKNGELIQREEYKQNRDTTKQDGMIETV